MCVCGLRIVSVDKILCFTNTLIIILLLLCYMLQRRLKRLGSVFFNQGFSSSCELICYYYMVLIFCLFTDLGDRMLLGPQVQFLLSFVH